MRMVPELINVGKKLQKIQTDSVILVIADSFKPNSVSPWIPFAKNRSASVCARSRSTAVTTSDHAAKTRQLKNRKYENKLLQHPPEAESPSYVWPSQETTNLGL